MLSSGASIAASAVESAASGSMLAVQKPVNVSAIVRSDTSSSLSILLVIALVEGTFDIKEKIKLDREFEVARLQNAEWRARIGQSSREKNTCGRGRRKEELT